MVVHVGRGVFALGQACPVVLGGGVPARPNFWGAHIMPTPFKVKKTSKFDLATHVEQRCVLEVSHASVPRYRVSALPNFGALLMPMHSLTEDMFNHWSTYRQYSFVDLCERWRFGVAVTRWS